MMKYAKRFMLLLLSLFMLSSCGQPPERGEINDTEEALQKDTLPNLHTNTSKRVETTLDTVFGDIKIAADVFVPDAENAPVLTVKLSDWDFDIEELTKFYFGKSTWELENEISGYEDVYNFTVDEKSLSATLYKESEYSSIAFVENMDLWKKKDYTFVEAINVSDDVERVNERLEQYGITFESLQKNIEDYSREYMEPVGLDFPYRIQCIWVIGTEGNYNFWTWLWVLRNNIPELGTFTLIGDSQMRLTGDNRYAFANHDTVYSFHVESWKDVIKEDEPEEEYLTLEAAMQLAAKEKGINNPATSNSTITNISFVYIPFPPEDAENKIEKDANNVWYTQEQLIPCWYFCSEQATENDADTFEFVVNAITGEAYSLHK